MFLEYCAAPCRAHALYDLTDWVGSGSVVIYLNAYLILRTERALWMIFGHMALV